MPSRARRGGACALCGAGGFMPARADGFLTTPEAAALVGVQPVTIRKWRRLGYLAPQGLDERGYPVHTREAVQAAEELVRQQGLEATKGKVDPRHMRKAATVGEAA
jgi:hypothetical protein